MDTPGGSHRKANGGPRRRVKLQHQREVLGRWFALYPRPPQQVMYRIVRESGLDAREVKRWFRNRRHLVKLAQGLAAPNPVATSPESRDAKHASTTAQSNYDGTGADARGGHVAPSGSWPAHVLDSQHKLAAAADAAWTTLSSWFDEAVCADVHRLHLYQLALAGIDTSELNVSILAGLASMLQSRPQYVAALRVVLGSAMFPPRAVMASSSSTAAILSSTGPMVQLTPVHHSSRVGAQQPAPMPAPAHVPLSQNLLYVAVPERPRPSAFRPYTHRTCHYSQ